MRKCGDCQLCCILVPVPEIGKLGNVRCRHQKFGTGCAIYHKPGFPTSCALWSCRWLVEDDTADLSRPDRSRYVIDLNPDCVRVSFAEGDSVDVEVVQIWCDPKAPDAHRDPALRAYLLRRGEEGVAGLVRWSSKEGMVIWPPQFDREGQWREQRSDLITKQNDLAEVVLRIGGGKYVLVDRGATP